MGLTCTFKLTLVGLDGMVAGRVRRFCSDYEFRPLIVEQKWR